jgi:hypothetical protein
MHDEKFFDSLVSAVDAAESNIGDKAQKEKMDTGPKSLSSAHFIHIAKSLGDEAPLDAEYIHPSILEVAKFSLPFDAEGEDARRVVAIGYGLGFAACLALMDPRAVVKPIHTVVAGIMAGSAAYHNIEVAENAADGENVTPSGG